MIDLSELQFAVIATDGVEESELTEPMAALRNAHADVAILSPGKKRIQAFRHRDKSMYIDADLALEQAEPGRFDALLLPGGALNADALRAEPKVQSFIRLIQEAGKPIAAICHAPWELVSAGLVQGRKLTSYHTIQDDIRNAGGDWIDDEVVVDANWITSRQPDDIPAFNREMLALFSQTRGLTPPAVR
jgi:protease I